MPVLGWEDIAHRVLDNHTARSSNMERVDIRSSDRRLLLLLPRWGRQDARSTVAEEDMSLDT